MVDYTGIERVQELVNRSGTAAFIEALASEIEADYRRWNEFDKSPRHAAHSAVGVIELMPITDGTLYSFKYVNGHPKNTAEGLLTVTAFGVLAEVATGYPILLSELTLTTALRTAATSALAARWMARKDSRTMALIGNGAQSEFQAIAFHHLIGIRELRLYDVDPAATAKLERNLAALKLEGLRVVRCASAGEAARGADIVTTVTADKRNAIILTPEMIEPGMHLNAVGGDCPGKTELAGAILARPDARVIVEYEPQSRDRGRGAADAGGLPRHRVRRGGGRPRAGSRERRRSHDLRLRRLRARGLLRAALPAPAAPRRARTPHDDRPRARTRQPQGPVRAAGAASGVDGRRRARGAADASPAAGDRMSRRPGTAALIGAPTDVGASERGASMGPEALRVAGLTRRLEDHGLRVLDRGNLAGPANPGRPPEVGYRHLAEVVEWNRLVHDAVLGELRLATCP
jgi:ornithine cyclodeaminase